MKLKLKQWNRNGIRTEGGKNQQREIETQKTTPIELHYTHWISTWFVECFIIFLIKNKSDHAQLSTDKNSITRYANCPTKLIWLTFFCMRVFPSPLFNTFFWNKIGNAFFCYSLSFPVQSTVILVNCFIYLAFFLRFTKQKKVWRRQRRRRRWRRKKTWTEFKRPIKFQLNYNKNVNWSISLWENTTTNNNEYDEIRHMNKIIYAFISCYTGILCLVPCTMCLGIYCDIIMRF